MLSHHNGNKWLLSGKCVSSIFDLFANPEIMEKKTGVGFFFDKPKNLRLAKKKTHPLGGLARNPSSVSAYQPLSTNFD